MSLSRSPKRFEGAGARGGRGVEWCGCAAFRLEFEALGVSGLDRGTLFARVRDEDGSGGGGEGEGEGDSPTIL